MEGDVKWIQTRWRKTVTTKQKAQTAIKTILHFKDLAEFTKE